MNSYYDLITVESRKFKELGTRDFFWSIESLNDGEVDIRIGSAVAQW